MPYPTVSATSPGPYESSSDLQAGSTAPSTTEKYATLPINDRIEKHTSINPAIRPEYTPPALNEQSKSLSGLHQSLSTEETNQQVWQGFHKNNPMFSRSSRNQLIFRFLETSIGRSLTPVSRIRKGDFLTPTQDMRYRFTLNDPASLVRGGRDN